MWFSLSNRDPALERGLWDAWDGESVPAEELVAAVRENHPGSVHWKEKLSARSYVALHDHNTPLKQHEISATSYLGANRVFAFRVQLPQDTRTEEERADALRQYQAEVDGPKEPSTGPSRERICNPLEDLQIFVREYLARTTWKPKS